MPYRFLCNDVQREGVKLSPELLCNGQAINEQPSPLAWRDESLPACSLDIFNNFRDGICERSLHCVRVVFRHNKAVLS